MTYLELVSQFPLVRITSDRQHDRALKVLEANKKSKKYVEVLVMLISEYENSTCESLGDDEILRYLMISKGVNQAEISKDTGIDQGTVSRLVNGKATLTRSQIATFATYFDVSASIFF